MMENEKNYVEINKKAWNLKTTYHTTSAFYDVPGFLQGKSTLNRPELDLLGDISGKKVLHLQCHFGLDTLSLGRLGADVTGVDFSDEAVKKAEELSQESGIPATFICCDVYDLPNHLDDTFDIVFTSYGTIGWLPNMDTWAKVIAHFLKPGGRLVFAEFHPVVWMFDTNMEKIRYRYFKSEPIVETEMGTYADVTAPIENKTVSWNHGLGEVLSSLIKNNIEITAFAEYDYSPYNCFSNMEEYEPGRFRFIQHKDMLPMIYALEGTRKS